MVKIHELSDVHIEFGKYQHEFPDANLLLLAGDIVVGARLRPQMTDRTSVLHKQYVVDFFTRAEAKYGKDIIWIPGNHEYYGGTAFQETLNDINMFMHASGLQTRIANRHLVAFHDIVIVAATLWTDFDGGNPLSMIYAQEGMNDYRRIRLENTGVIGRSHGADRDLRAQDVYDRHLDDLAFLKRQIGEVDTDRMVFMTHHAPSFMSIHPGYRDSQLNGAYATNLEYMMGGIIKAWFHGHVHHDNNYNVNGTNVIANPRGYEGYELAPGFNPNFVVEI